MSKDVTQMSEEELSKIDMENIDGDSQLPADDSADDAPVDDTDSADDAPDGTDDDSDDSDNEDSGDKLPDEKIQKDSSDPPPDEEDDEPEKKALSEIAQKRISDAQKKMYEALNEKRQAHLENIKMKKMLLEKRRSELEATDDDDYLEPDEAIQRHQERADLDKQYDQIANEVASNVQEGRFANVVQFFKAQGYDYDETKGLEQQSPELIEFINSDEFQAVNRYFDRNPVPPDHITTVDEMQRIYRAENFDILVKKAVENATSKAEINGRQQAVKDIQNAHGNGSRMDRVKSDSSSGGLKRLEDMTPDEIAKLPEDIVLQLSAEIE